MTIDTCPRCVGVHLDGGEREAEREGERRRLDGRMPQPLGAGEAARLSLPDETPDPVPVETKEPDEHGYLPAAAIFAAQGLASILAFGAGAPPEILSAVANLVTAAMLLKQAGWAKWLVLVGALLGAGQGIVAFVLTGHWLAVVATLPSLCVLGAFWFETPRLRLAASVVGAILAFSWFALAASVTGEDGGDPLAAYALPDRTFSDPAAGLSVVVPAELAGYDLQKLRAGQGGRKGGVLGLLSEEGMSLESAGQRVMARTAKDEVVAIVSVGSLPPQIPSESLLPTLLGVQARVERADDLVPRPLRISGLATQAWRDATRQVLLVRAPDGRMAAVVCNVHQRAAERLCGALFGGVALAMGKQPGRAGQEQGQGPDPRQQQ
jgi:hypothetical protein